MSSSRYSCSILMKPEFSTIHQLGRYARIVDHLAVKNVAQCAPLGGGSISIVRWA